jgi:hypothetical protein
LLLGDLNSGLVCFPYGHQAYPDALTAQLLRRTHIRSLTACRKLSLPKHAISALPHAPSQLRSACEQFREEPAITGLDWSFAPIPRSSKRFAHQYWFGPPPFFRRASPCPGIDRPASGIQLLTPGERTLSLACAADYRFPYGFVHIVLNLANNRNSTDQFSNRTV